MSSKKLGFYFALLQSDPQNRTITLWIDGDDLCEFYTWEDFFEMIKEYDEVKRKRVFGNEVLFTSSVWFWDVDKGSIRIAKRAGSKGDLDDNIVKLISSERKKEEYSYKGRAPQQSGPFTGEDLNLIFKKSWNA